MTLTVVDPGLYTLVVDPGRPASRSLGVPLGGAADRAALALGNALVGNLADAAALEITLSGPTLLAECELACVLYGAPFPMESDRQRLRAGKTFTMAAGEGLRIGATIGGMRGYFCVGGGFELPRVLGSRTAFEPLQAGAPLPCAGSTIRARFLPSSLGWQADSLSRSWPGKPGFVYGLHGNRDTVLRVLDGAQVEWFDLEKFYGQCYRVSPASNRMGLRLQGQALAVPDRELLSEPVCPGSVQVTRDGQCIVLGVDGQTIGGYPKIAQVITADLDLLGQLRPEEELRFEHVTLEDAEQLYRRWNRTVNEWMVRLQETVHLL
jgi:5-oxoprolinase (ATP-hydrolysing) subunit C